MKQKIYSILAVLFMALLLIPMMPASKVAAEDIKDVYCAAYTDVLAIIESRGHSADAKYYYMIMYEGTYRGSPYYRAKFYAHSDDSHPYFVNEGGYSSKNYHQIAVETYWYQCDDTRNTSYYHYDSIQQGWFSSSTDASIKAIYANCPVINGETEENNYLAGQEYKTLDYIDVGNVEPEFDASVPMVKNAYVSYKIHDVFGHTTFYLNFDFPEEAAGMNAQIYIQAHGELGKWNYGIFGMRQQEDFTSDKIKQEPVAYKSSSVKLEYSGEYFQENLLPTYDKDYYLIFDEIIFYIQIEANGKKGSIVKVVFDMDTMSSTLTNLGTEYVANGSSGVIDNDGDITTADKSTTSNNQDFSNYASIDADGLIGFVKNGLGLVGDDGIVPMLATTFEFIPEPIWIIMTAVFSIIGLIIIIKVLA